MAFLEHLENIFEVIVQYSVLLLEFAGVVILLFTACKCFYAWLRHTSDHIPLELAHGIALSLEFKLGGEVLRTAIVREQSELIFLGTIILLRGALTLLIHWEIKAEESRLNAHIQPNSDPQNKH